MNEQPQMRQFYLRVILSIGLLWGTALLVQLLMFAVTAGANESFLDSVAVVSNCLTVGPACLLAFWHRRAASVWLALNGILLLTASTRSMWRLHQYDLSIIIGTLIPILLAFCLVVIDLRRWPGALLRDKR
ncbi:MAG TPA: hypothetical protein VMT38_05885 [Terracidiphilus sp.]|nr:hypothetical protein [Terracidiphilus sp.]